MTERTPAFYETVLLWTVLGMMAFGLVMVYSASGVYAGHRFNNDTYFLRRQAVALGLALVALIVGRRMEYTHWRMLAYPLLATSVLLLLFVVFKGVRVGGAVRWLRFGGFSFQPSELARFALVVYLAAMLGKKGDKIRTFAFGFLPAMLITALLAALVLAQPDLGTAVTFGILTLLLLFVAGGRIGYLMAFVPVGAGALVYLIWKAPYRLQRLMAFLHPEEHAQGSAYHLIQSILALGSGGPWGLGLGMSRQKLGYIPEAHTDFIMAIIGEELGLIGVFLLLLGYAIVFCCGLRAAQRLQDPFGRALALGIALAICVSAAINMAVVSGLMPTKGLVLPFISYGGSSLIVNALFAGVLMNILRHAEFRPGEAV